MPAARRTRSSRVRSAGPPAPIARTGRRGAAGGCGIRYVNVLDYVASARQARIEHRAAADPAPAIEVGYDGWVLPTAGMAFVWTIEDEMAAQHASRRA